MAIVYSKIVSQPNPIGGVSEEVTRHVVDKTKSLTPNYGRIVRLGQRLPENPYTLVVTKRSNPWRSVNRRTNLSGFPAVDSNVAKLFIHPGDFFSSVTQSGSPMDMAKIDAKALTRLYDSSKYYQTNVGLMVAEGRKTLDLIASTATRLAGFYSSLRRFQFRRALRFIGLDTSRNVRGLSRKSRNFNSGSKFAASAFLEYSYGWVPLLSDVYSSAQDLAKRNLSRSDDVTIRGAFVDSGVISYKVNPQGSSSPNQRYTGNLVISKIGANEVTRRVSYKLSLRMANQSLRTKANLGLTNPLTLAWELLPFSFVVDWFLPVGEYLESLSAFSGLQFVDGSKTQFQRTRRNVQFTGSTGYGSSYFRTEITSDMAYNEEIVSLTRAKLSSIPAWRPEKWLSPLGVAVSDRPLKALALLRATIK